MERRDPHRESGVECRINDAYGAFSRGFSDPLYTSAESGCRGRKVRVDDGEMNEKGAVTCCIKKDYSYWSIFGHLPAVQGGSAQEPELTNVLTGFSTDCVDNGDKPTPRFLLDHL